jgi:hypothetical protein
VIVLLVVVILVGVVTVGATLAPGASAAIGARIRNEPVGELRPSLRHRIATSWLGALVWNRRSRVKGPSISSRLRDSELGRSWKTRKDVKQTRNRIEQRRKR